MMTVWDQRSGCQDFRPFDCLRKLLLRYKLDHHDDISHQWHDTSQGYMLSLAPTFRFQGFVQEVVVLAVPMFGSHVAR